METTEGEHGIYETNTRITNIALVAHTTPIASIALVINIPLTTQNAQSINAVAQTSTNTHPAKHISLSNQTLSSFFFSVYQT